MIRTRKLCNHGARVRYEAKKCNSVVDCAGFFHLFLLTLLSGWAKLTDAKVLVVE